MSEAMFDADGYPTTETLETIAFWLPTDFIGLMGFVVTAWSNYGWFENRPSKIVWSGWKEDDRDDGGRWCCATGGWSGNESIIDALMRNDTFWLCCWRASLWGGYYEFEVRESKP